MQFKFQTKKKRKYKKCMILIDYVKKVAGKNRSVGQKATESDIE